MKSIVVVAATLSLLGCTRHSPYGGHPDLGEAAGPPPPATSAVDAGSGGEDLAGGPPSGGNLDAAPSTGTPDAAQPAHNDGGAASLSLLPGDYLVQYIGFVSNGCLYATLPPDEEWQLTSVDADTVQLYVGPAYPTMVLTRTAGRFAGSYSAFVAPNAACQVVRTVEPLLTPTGGDTLTGVLGDSIQPYAGVCAPLPLPCETDYQIALTLLAASP
jgi:hypothetical protein